MSYEIPRGMEPWPRKAATASTRFFYYSLMLYLMGVLIAGLDFSVAPTIGVSLVRLGFVLNVVGLGAAIAAICGSGPDSAHPVILRALLGLILNLAVLGIVLNRAVVGGMIWARITPLFR